MANINNMAIRKFSAYLNEFLAKLMQDEDIPTSLLNVALAYSGKIITEVKEEVNREKED